MRLTYLLWIVAVSTALGSWWVDRAPQGPRGIAAVAEWERPQAGPATPLQLGDPGPAGIYPDTLEVITAPDLGGPGEFQKVLDRVVPDSWPDKQGRKPTVPVRTAESATNPAGELPFYRYFLSDAGPMPALIAPRCTSAILRALVADLRRAERRQIPDSWVVGISPAHDARRIEIERALDRPVNIDADGPLAKVLADVGEQIGVRVAFDTVAFEPFDFNSKVRIRLYGASARSALRLIFNHAVPIPGLVICPCSSGLWLTTSDFANRGNPLWIHSVADIVQHDPAWSATQIRNLMEELLWHTLWERDRHPSRMECLGDMLVAAESQNDEVRQFVGGLHRVAGPRSGLEPEVETPAARLSALLARRVRVSAKDEPLAKLLERISKEYEVPIYIPHTLRHRIPLREDVTIELPEMPFGDAIDMLLAGRENPSDPPFPRSTLLAGRQGDVLILSEPGFRNGRHATVEVYSLRHLQDPIARPLSEEMREHLRQLLVGGSRRPWRGLPDWILPVPGGMAVRHDQEHHQALAKVLAPGSTFSRTARYALVDEPGQRIPRLIEALAEDDPWTVALALRELARLKADPVLVRPAVERMLAGDVLARPHHVRFNSYMEPLAAFGEPRSLTLLLLRMLSPKRSPFREQLQVEEAFLAPEESLVRQLPAPFRHTETILAEYLDGDQTRRESIFELVSMMLRGEDIDAWLETITSDPNKDRHPAIVRDVLRRLQSKGAKNQ